MEGLDQVKPRSVSMNVDTGEKTWLTPPWIVQKLGHFDLDPCTPPVMPWRTADRMISLQTESEVECPVGFVRTEPGDGTKVDWEGKRVWCNPPYGRESVPFLERFARLTQSRGGGGTSLYLRVPTLGRGSSGSFRSRIRFSSSQAVCGSSSQTERKARQRPHRAQSSPIRRRIRRSCLQAALRDTL